MADHFIGINKGKDVFAEVNWVYGTSTGSTDFEVRFGDAFGFSRQDLILILEGLAGRLAQNEALSTAAKVPNL